MKILLDMQKMYVHVSIKLKSIIKLKMNIKLET